MSKLRKTKKQDNYRERSLKCLPIIDLKSSKKFYFEISFAGHLVRKRKHHKSNSEKEINTSEMKSVASSSYDAHLYMNYALKEISDLIFFFLLNCY